MGGYYWWICTAHRQRTFLYIYALLLLFSHSAQLCLILYNPMNCSTPGLSVPHYLPEFSQTYVHWISDAIQPSFPLSPLSPLALGFSIIKNPMFMFIGLICKNYNFFNIWKTWNQNFSVQSKILLEYILLFCTLYLHDFAWKVTFFNMALAFLYT